MPHRPPEWPTGGTPYLAGSKGGEKIRNSSRLGHIQEKALSDAGRCRRLLGLVGTRGSSALPGNKQTKRRVESENSDYGHIY